MPRVATTAVHAGISRDAPDGEVSPAIHLSTTYERDDDGALRGEFSYARTDNRNRRSLERCLADLEAGADAACFASGSAAANALLQCLRPDDRVVIPREMYHGVREMMRVVTSRAGVRSVEIDLSDMDATRRALDDGARLVWCETPANPSLRITDIAALAELSRSAGSAVVVDNTFATPVFQRPLELGADFVLHSTTKFLGGHSDVTGGAIVARDAEHPLWEPLRETQRFAGAVPSPFDCWLTRRGIATLAVRMNAHAANAAELAAWLAGHEGVERVDYPGLEAHPGHDVAARQMSGFGGVLSFLVAGGEPAARRFMSGIRLMHRATSLGGVHSLIEHRTNVEPPTSPVPRNLIRVSVGIEDVRDLKADLEAGFSRVHAGE